MSTVRNELLADLRRDEGLVLNAYPDPLSPLAKACARMGFKGDQYRRVTNWQGLSGNPWTIGFGHTGPDVSPGAVWTLEKCNEVLRHDAEKHCGQVSAAFPWVARLDPVRQDVLFNMGFNMGCAPNAPKGRRGLADFVNTMKMVEIGDYDRAAVGMLNSAWARQVGARSTRLAKMMRTGAR